MMLTVQMMIGSVEADRRNGNIQMAEGEGFEPPVRFPVHRFSRPTVSTAHTSLRETPSKPGVGLAGLWLRRVYQVAGVSEQDYVGLQIQPVRDVGGDCGCGSSAEERVPADASSSG